MRGKVEYATEKIEEAKKAVSNIINEIGLSTKYSRLKFTLHTESSFIYEIDDVRETLGYDPMCVSFDVIYDDTDPRHSNLPDMYGEMTIDDLFDANYNNGGVFYLNFKVFEMNDQNVVAQLTYHKEKLN